MTNKEQIIEYPYCRSCDGYACCKKWGLNKYRPKFLFKNSCYDDCAYDHECFFGGTPYECPEFREWCYNDMEVAKELNIQGCYKEPFNLAKWVKDFVYARIQEGKIVYTKLRGKR